MTTGIPAQTSTFRSADDPNGAEHKSSGFAILANDKVMHWLIPFLESWKQHSATIPMYLIPYDDDMEKTRRVAAVYGVTIADVDSRQLDALSKRLYPLGIRKRSRLRKLLSLALPLDEVIYLDVDIILFRDFTPLLGLIRPDATDFIVIASEADGGYVYNKRRHDYEFLARAKLFNDGFFVTSNKILSIEDFFDVIRDDERLFHRVRQRGGLYAQPLTNFVVHRKDLKIVPLFDCVDRASSESYHKAEGVTFTDDGPMDRYGKQIYFCHWPGVGRPGKLIFDDLWRGYAARGEARLEAAGV